MTLGVFLPASQSSLGTDSRTFAGQYAFIPQVPEYQHVSIRYLKSCVPGKESHSQKSDMPKSPWGLDIDTEIKDSHSQRLLHEKASLAIV